MADFVSWSAPMADFFGFFGALKKGDFFGVHPKKVGEGPRARAERCKKALPPAVLSLSPLAPCGRGAGGEGSNCSGRGRSDGAKPGDFFGARPKKVPLIAVGGKQDSVDLAQLLFHSLFFSPKGSSLCDTKYRRKILFRNFPAREMLQQTEKKFGRDSSPRCYTRARKEFRGIW
jgi:hypothetical protein